MSGLYKQVFNRMNLDADVRRLKPGEHRKLYNGITVQPASSTVPLDGIIASMFGNALVSNSDLAGGTNKIIGGVEDRPGNRYFFCVYNSTAANNTVYQYKGGVITRVLRSALWAFASTDYVDMDIVGDFLILTNNNSEVKKINITKAIAGATYTPAADEITLIKRPPLSVLVWTVLYDTYAYANNYVAGNYFQFFHRFIYEDGDRSVFGGASKMTDSWVLPSTTVEVAGVNGTNYTLSGTTGFEGQAIPAGTRILLKNQTDPKENGIWVSAAGAWSRATDADSSAELRALNVYVKFGFENGGTTWRNTNDSAITIGVTNITFLQIEGPNAIDVSIDVTEIPATVRQVEYAVRVNGTNELFVYRIDKTPLAGTPYNTHRFYNDTYLFTVPDSEAFKWSDSIPIKSKAVKFIKNRLFLFNNTEGYTHTTTTNVVLTAVAITPTDTRAVRHFKDGGTYRVGVVFFDTPGRFVGGVHCDATITIPYRKATSSSLIPTDPPYKITVNLAGIAMADIPLSAVYYAVVVTNITNKAFFLTFVAYSIYYYIEDADGLITYTQTFPSAGIKGCAIDITSLTQQGLGYTFNKGDRIRLQYLDDPVVYDIEIVAQSGRFVLTQTITPKFSLFLAYCEIYTPKETTIEPFFEVGDKYRISNAGTGSRSFVSTSIDPTGDISSVLRNLFSTSGGGPTDPFGVTYTKDDQAYFEAMNSYDKSFENWIKPGARSVIKSQYDSVEQSKTRHLRFSQPYEQNSNILQLNTFNALDEQALPIENGPGTGLAVAGEVLVAIHEVEATAVYVGQGFINTSNGNNFLAKTESVIGDTRRYLGGHGSIHQGSIVSREGVVYYLDARKGAIIRRSQDGLTRISDYGVQGYVSALCTAHVALGANSRIIAGWDPQYDCYVISFIDTTGPTGYTLYWHEKTNSWTCLSDLRPEFWGQLGQNQLGFLSGALWAQSVEANYNLFFGVQYNRRLEWEVGSDSLEKIWEAIEVDVESIYSIGGSNEAIVLLYHVSGGTLQNQINYLDFRQKASAWRSSVFRNLNDASMGSTTESKYKSFHNTRGQSAFLVITYNGTDKNPMKSISLFFRPSMNSTQ